MAALEECLQWNPNYWAICQSRRNQTQHHIMEICTANKIQHM